jgi:hypothetical protein
MRSGLCCYEPHFANQNAAPGLIDVIAEVPLHRFELTLPGFAVGFQFKAIVLATNRAGVRGEMWSNDGWPGAGEPRESCVRLLEAPNDTAKELSRAFHEAANSSTTALWICASLRRRIGRAKIARHAPALSRSCIQRCSRSGRECGDIV